MEIQFTNNDCKIWVSYTPLKKAALHLPHTWVNSSPWNMCCMCIDSVSSIFRLEMHTMHQINEKKIV